VFGRRYGERAVRWLEEKGGRASRVLRWVERQFGRARYAVVALLPGTNVVWLLAGSSEMPMGAFVGISAVALIVRYIVLRLVASAFTAVIIDITDWIGNNQVWLTALSITSVALFVWWGRRSGHTDIESVEEIAEELDDL
jgi:membrane protein DedA with SNARE-associated domain